MRTPFKVVLCRFSNSSGDYSYFVPSHWNVEEGDGLIVFVGNGIKKHAKIVEVTKTIGISKAQRDCATTVAAMQLPCDLLLQWRQLQREVDMFFEIKQRLKELKEQSEELQVYQALAGDNEEAKQLLEMLASLGSGNARLALGNGDESTASVADDGDDGDDEKPVEVRW